MAPEAALETSLAAGACADSTGFAGRAFFAMSGLDSAAGVLSVAPTGSAKTSRNAQAAAIQQLREFVTVVAAVACMMSLWLRTGAAPSWASSPISAGLGPA